MFDGGNINSLTELVKFAMEKLQDMLLVLLCNIRNRQTDPTASYGAFCATPLNWVHLPYPLDHKRLSLILESSKQPKSCVSESLASPRQEATSRRLEEWKW
ncbi:hypothetical protein EGR_09547 [Echinococcus granulosus]|uniref:Uncharacterized protein n=1 Tax=Echinococcus granulosus TaxID=6210 RepID=W6UAW0_ECHGR|nr:hypothetical protein EGR_09547 [Echinococcus granulosus]EUB55607.1 hypothetical protein EGR_09547 [Echinococcus granulosus]